MYKKFIILIIVEVIFLNTLVEGEIRKNDTLSIPAVHLSTKDMIEDSDLILPDTLYIRDSTEYNYWKNVINNRKSKVGKLISKIIFDVPDNKVSQEKTSKDAVARFEAFRGKRVSRIEVKVLPPYGYSVYDTIEPDMRSFNWIYKVADKTHIKTSEKLITKQLTTKIGYPIDPFVMVQEEISLKNLEIINDALIILEADPGNAEQVTMKVICKDKFTWSGFVGTNFKDQFSLEIENINLFGMGQSLSYGFEFEGDKWKKYGHNIKFEYPNIGGSHINASLKYKNNHADKIISGEVELPFITNLKKWAGGIGYDRVYYSHELPDKNVSWLKDKFNYRSYDMWFGHLFNIKDKNRFDRNLYLTGRTYSTIFRKEHPDPKDDVYHFYCDRYNSLVSLQFTRLKYYKVVQFFDLGRSEYIPHGINIGSILGFEKNKIESSNYLEAWTTVSHFNDKTEQYYGGSVSIGSYVNGNGFNRGYLKADARFVSHPFPMGTSYIWRIYNDLNYTVGFKRYPEEYIFIEDPEIRGFQSDSLFGTKKLGASISWMTFSPQLKYDFRFAFGTFLDLGIIGPKEKSVFRNKSYFGIGAQLNIQNNFLFIKNIAIRFAFYPKIPKGCSHYDFMISSWNSNKLYDFSGNKPKMTIFK